MLCYLTCNFKFRWDQWIHLYSKKFGVGYMNSLFPLSSITGHLHFNCLHPSLLRHISSRHYSIICNTIPLVIVPLYMTISIDFHSFLSPIGTTINCLWIHPYFISNIFSIYFHSCTLGFSFLLQSLIFAHVDS